MPATYPAGIPYRVLRAGAAMPEGNNVLRSATDSTLARQRAKSTVGVNRITGNIRMTLAEYYTFRDFRQGLGGATFNWPGHPSGTVEARFVGDVDSTPVPDPQTSKWLVPVAIEVMP